MDSLLELTYWSKGIYLSSRWLSLLPDDVACVAGAIIWFKKQLLEYIAVLGHGTHVEIPAAEHIPSWRHTKECPSEIVGVFDALICGGFCEDARSVLIYQRYILPSINHALGEIGSDKVRNERIMWCCKMGCEDGILHYARAYVRAGHVDTMGYMFVNLRRHGHIDIAQQVATLILSMRGDTQRHKQLRQTATDYLAGSLAPLDKLDDGPDD